MERTESGSEQPIAEPQYEPFVPSDEAAQVAAIDPTASLLASSAE